ncbi:DUF2155 domain-containing protein [Paramylibacter kogurei]|uniref:DUF2155 domain-containing protein n=1 Tax=Paramylibacter kogurei TaxID=1889778 RepID=UPI00196B67C6|nr:DUF2155 domain-containing protein [Amylibacter kogurei]
MIRIALTSLAFLMALPGFAAVKTTNGSGAIIRMLDRVTGQVADFEMQSGSTIEVAKIQVTLKECRYPQRRLNTDAFAHLLILDSRMDNPAFDGWMVASSPALSALEHPRYDVWVIKCLAPK